MIDNKRIVALRVFEEYLDKYKNIPRDVDWVETVAIAEQLCGEIKCLGLEYRNYRRFESEWEWLTRNDQKDKLEDCSMVTYLGLITYCMREDHWCSGDGHDLYKRTMDGTFLFLITKIVERLHEIGFENDKSRTNELGVSGEYFVIAELTRQGYVASLTSKNTKAIDILASSKDGRRCVSIQVKSCSNNKLNTWKLNEKVEAINSDNIFYVFVNLNEGNSPVYFIVPSGYVAETVKNNHQEWLNTPNKQGGRHNDTPMRTFRIDEEYEAEWKDAWYLLGLD